LKDYFKNLILKLPACCQRKSKKQRIERKTNVQLFNEGKDRVTNYFDIVKLVRLFREMQMFLSTVLTPEQRLLLLFQRKLLISECREPSSNDEEDAA